MKKAERIYERNIWKIMAIVAVFMLACMTMSFKVHAEAKACEPYILPNSSTMYLPNSDVLEMPLQVLCYGKNEIYARHGRKFSSQELQNYFNNQSWYYGTIEPGDFSESVLNTYEAANVKDLTAREKELGSYKLDVAGYSYEIVNNYINKREGTVTYESTDVLSGDPYKVSVSQGYLALRSKPEYDDANEKGKLYTGDGIFVKDYSNPQYWYVYAPRCQEYGYVNKDYIVKNSNASDTSTSSSSYNFPVIYKTVKVDKGYLALRSEKSFNSGNEKGELYTGDVVEVRDSSDPTYWLVYSSKYNDTGYVNMNYLY